MAADVAAFRRRPAPPTGGEGRLVVGPLGGGGLLGAGASVTLSDAGGAQVAST